MGNGGQLAGLINIVRTCILIVKRFDSNSYLTTLVAGGCRMNIRTPGEYGCGRIGSRFSFDLIFYLNKYIYTIDSSI